MGEIKKYKIIWSPTFIKELDNICDYMTTYLKETAIAKRFYHKVVEKLDSLKYFPERHIKMKIKDIEFRKILLKNYIIIYQINFKTRRSCDSTYISWQSKLFISYINSIILYFLKISVVLFGKVLYNICKMILGECFYEFTKQTNNI